MVSLNRITILQLANILTPIICFGILSILSIGQGDVTGVFESAEYDSLIDPINFAFAIWGPIFLLLFVFLIYQARGVLKNSKPENVENIIEQVGIYFILSTIFTSLWYLFWFYQIIWLSTLSMILYLISLVRGYLRLKINLVERTTTEKITVVAPWSIYTGWVTAATIISIKTFMIYLGFNELRFLPDRYWAIIVLLMTLLIYITVLLMRNDFIYAGVGIWVLLGILFERLLASDLLIEIILTTIIGLIVLTAAIIYQAIIGKKK